MAMSPEISGLGMGLGVAGNIAGSLIQANAARAAAAAQREAIARGIAESNKYYDRGVAGFDPYAKAGGAAVGQLPGMIAGMEQPEYGYQQKEFDFKGHQDPGAEYALQEAAKALNASSIAKGAMGGGALKAMATEQNNLAQTAYRGAWDRWLDESKLKQGQAENAYARDYGWQNNQIEKTAGLASMGQQAAGSQATLLGAQAAGQVAPYTNMGGASAAGTLGAANATGAGINGTLGALGAGMGSLWQNWNLQNADKSVPPTPWTGGSGEGTNLAGVVGTGNTAGNADYGRPLKRYESNDWMVG